MEILRLDHIHIKAADTDDPADLLEDMLGVQFIRGIDYTDDYGEEAAFAPYPVGLEVIAVTDPEKKLAQPYVTAEDGLFAISLKVEDIDKAIAHMEGLGYPLIEKYGFGTIMEALLDTKEALGFYIEFIQYEGDDITAVDSGY